MYQGLYTSQQSNQRKTIVLLMLFPLFLMGAIFLVMWYLSKNSTQAWAMTQEYAMYLFPIVTIWAVISFLFQKELLFYFSGAKEVTRMQEPQIYNIVENLCISRGLPVPKIGIIETPGLNAFALGWKPESSRVVFTRGLINHLEEKEIQAVAAHELSHVINKDSLLMLVMVVYIGAISALGEILIRFSTGNRGGGDEKKWNPLVALGFALVILGYIVYPLIRLAISRKREFLADAGAVELTHDAGSMISALEKIAQNPDIPLENEKMSAMFIQNPLSHLSSLFQTHPSIEERIAALKNY